jgi:pilus assembly protein CpaC
MRHLNKWFFLVSIPAVLSSVFLSVPLAYPEFFSDDFDLTKQMDVVVGESKIVTVANPKRIAIGDPDIADVVGASTTEVIISAKKAGETNLQIWDDFGQREITLRIFQEDLNKLKKRLEDLFATAGIREIIFQVGEQERKIFVLGDVPLRKKEVVTQLLDNFKDKIINLIVYKEDNPLVQIDTQIIEIAKTAIDQLGINWSSSFVFTEVQPPVHTLSRQVGDLLKAVGQAKFGVGSATAPSLALTLNLLEQDNLARTLARPKLVAQSGKEAKFLVGGSVPVLGSVSVASGTTTSSVNYVDIGIKLNIKPEVKENGDIACKMEVEIKTVDTSNQLVINSGSNISTSTPAFKTRNVSSELYLKNNQTIFLAGLIDNEEKNNLQNVPGLANLPILGALFRSRDYQRGDTELVISLTPKIVNYGDMRQDIMGAAGGGAVKKEANEDPADSYVRTIQEMILKNVSYPLEAQRANLSGDVVLSLHLLSNGQLLGVVVSQSSGHALLDKAAIFTVKKLAPYPVFPKGLLLKEIWVDVPIAYQLN